jgi:GT2 family glycosyltransferase
MNPAISVVIPAFNASDTIGKAIQSALEQDERPLEVIVVDDGSSDDTPDRARAAGARVIRQSNAGVSAARNRGILAANGDWIAFLDADDRFLPGKLAQQIAALARYPYANFVFCDMQREQDGVIVESRWFMDRAPYQRLTKTRLDTNLVMMKGDALSCALLDENFIPTSSVLVRKTAISNPGFDADIRYCEDVELWLRIIKDNEVLAIEMPLTNYRLHSASASAQWQHILHGNLTLLERIAAHPERYADPLVGVLPERITAGLTALGIHLVRSGDTSRGTHWLRQALQRKFVIKTAGWLGLGYALSVPGIGRLRKLRRRAK